MRTEILAKHPDARLRVYVIWTVKLTFDARDQWDGGGLTDPRVIHLWDPQDLVGDWLVANLPDNQAGDWDAYWVFDSTANWTKEPPALISSGSSVIGESETLASSITPLLKG